MRLKNPKVELTLVGVALPPEREAEYWLAMETLVTLIRAYVKSRLRSFHWIGRPLA